MDEVDASRGRGSETGARLPKLHSAPAPRAGGNGSCLPRGRGGSGLNMIVAQTSAAVFVMSIAGGASIRERRCRQMRACETVPMQTSDSWILVVGPKQETVKFNAWPCGRLHKPQPAESSSRGARALRARGRERARSQPSGGTRFDVTSPWFEPVGPALRLWLCGLGRSGRPTGALPLPPGALASHTPTALAPNGTRNEMKRARRVPCGCAHHGASRTLVLGAATRQPPIAHGLIKRLIKRPD